VSVTREEFAELARLVDTIDAGGTRGTIAAVSTLSSQMVEVIKDVNDLKGDLSAHRQEHVAEQHARTKEHAARAARTRWIIGTIVVLFAAVEAPLLTLLFSHLRFH